MMEGGSPQTPKEKDRYFDSRIGPPPSSKRRRQPRDSVVCETGRFNEFLRERVGALKDLWDEMGMEDAKRGDRMAIVFGFLTNILDNMYLEEKRMKEGMEEEIERWGEEVSLILSQLSLHHQHSMRQRGMIEEHEGLRDELRELRVLKETRLRERERLREEERGVSEILGLETFYLPDGIPTEEHLEDLRRHVNHMRELWEERKKEALDTQRRVRCLMRRMAYEPQTEEERRVVEAHPDSIHTLPLTSATMKALRALANRIEEEWVEHVGKMRGRLEEAREELRLWMDKCLVPEEQREVFPPIDKEDCTEETLRVYQEGAEKWRRRYREREGVLAKVKEWENFFAEMRDWEERDRRVSLYKDRGGNLQKVLKRQSQLKNHLLPRARREISEAVRVWEASHPQSEEGVFIGGLDPLTHVDGIQRDYQTHKEQEKAKKKREQMRRRVNETRYGTPLPKRVKSPVKFARGTPRTPSAAPHQSTQRTPGRQRLVYPALSPASTKPPVYPGGRAVRAGLASGSQIPRYGGGRGRVVGMGVVEGKKNGDVFAVPSFRGTTPAPAPPLNDQATLDSLHSYGHFTVTVHSRNPDDNLVSTFYHE